MKIAILTDIHGNLPALQGALKAIQQEGCDEIFHTGDAIGIGPYPAECLDLLLSTPHMHLITGNHDAWFANGLPTPRPSWMSDGELEHQQWIHSCLDPSLQKTVGSWPYLIQDVFEDIHVAFLHYALTESKKNFASIIKDPSPADLDELFTGLKSDIVFYGHQHSSSDIEGNARYVNPGSLGCHTVPIARFAILECQQPQYELRLCHIPYDDRDLFRQFEERRVPEHHFICQAFFGGRYPGTGAYIR